MCSVIAEAEDIGVGNKSRIVTGIITAYWCSVEKIISSQKTAAALYFKETLPVVLSLSIKEKSKHCEIKA